MNIIKTVFRNIKVYKTSSVFNFIGLITAFTVFVLIMLYVYTEYRFDTYHQDYQDIYRLELMTPGKSKSSVYMSGLTKDVIQEQLPEVVATTLYMPWGKWEEILLEWEQDGEKKSSYEDYAISDKHLTEVFTFDFLHATTGTPLAEPNSVMVSDAFALKLWGTTEVMGKTLRTPPMAGSEQNEYRVTAVFRTPPRNSLFNEPVIFSFPTTGWIEASYKSWGIVNFPEFIRVTPGTDRSLLQAGISSIDILKEKYSFYDKESERAEVIVRPLSELRFTKEVAESPLFNTNNRASVNILLIVGIFILVIAVLNYINFATAMLPKRMKNIGMSRILGSSGRRVVTLHIAEAVLFFIVSFLIGVALAAIINQHFGAGLFEYRLDFTLCIVPLLVMALVAILSGVAAGTIPALGSMAITPADAVKRKYTLARSSSRGWLTVVQFAATIALIAMSALTVKQVRFMKNRPLGFDKENRMVIIPTNDLVENLEAFELALQKSPLIETTALSNGVPGVPSNMEGFRFNDETYQTWLWNVDDKYVKMMNFELTEGRHFLPDSEAEQNSIIINETAKRQFGLEPGSHIMKGDAKGNPVYYQVVGVIKDFNFASLRESVEPFMFRYMPGTFYGFVNVKLATNDVKSTVDFVTKEYNKLSPHEPIRYYFLDERLNLLYDKEDRVIGMIAMFSLLSLVVSVLGVLGLSIFTSQYRIREIGIRKVNGASIPEIVQMLNRNVVVWLGIAFVIATPIAYYAMSRWLENFAYKTALSWWIFAVAGLAALVVALLTVSWQSLRAASRNPVEALKYE